MTGVRTEVSMDEIGAQIAAAAAGGTDPSTMKLEGDKIPEALRGKTVADLIAQRDLAEQTASIATKARQAAEERANAGGNREVIREVERVAPVDLRLTKEQLAELFEKDPIGAVAYMQDIAIKDAAGQFERRFAPLAAGSASVAETAARDRFKDEFELFGGEIKAITDALPDKSVLANPEGWKNIVAFVRGKDGNFEKLIAHKGKSAAEAAAIAARAEQDRGAGASMTGVVTGAGGGGGGSTDTSTYGLTKEELSHADKQNLTPKEYAFWKNQGG